MTKCDSVACSPEFGLSAGHVQGHVHVHGSNVKKVDRLSSAFEPLETIFLEWELLDFETLCRVMFHPDSDEKTMHIDVLKRYLKLIYEEGMIEGYRKASIGKKEGNEAIKANFEGSHLLAFKRRIRYFSSDIVSC